MYETPRVLARTVRYILNVHSIDSTIRNTFDAAHKIFAWTMQRRTFKSDFMELAASLELPPSQPSAIGMQTAFQKS